MYSFAQRNKNANKSDENCQSWVFQCQPVSRHYRLIYKTYITIIEQLYFNCVTKIVII